MSNKRTKNKKLNTHYPFLISWNKNTENQNFASSVKRETNKTDIEIGNKDKSIENAKKLVISNEIEFIKKDIKKSLATTSFILLLEIMIYLAWKRFFLL